MPFPRGSKALSRFTVLDLTRVRSGPTCVRQLADWGAEVVKIEDPKGDGGLGGDRHGPFGGFVGDRDRAFDDRDLNLAVARRDRQTAPGLARSRGCGSAGGWG